MLKNKSVLLIALLLGMVFATGCVQQSDLGKGSTTYNTYLPPTDHTYLKNVLSSLSYVSKNQQFDVNFVIENPLQQSVDNLVELRYDIPSCFTNSEKTTTVTTPPKSSISSGKSVTVNYYSDTKCSGTRTLTVVISDKSGAVIDYSSLLVNVKS